ncbi:NACHT domain-containing protein [Streptomyces sp. MBT62]|uniref:NACHT domain-containing protein n=1 Tax=Streptomyces sp. MBT62 TaxID=2800410 RepID=UPI00190A4229|nr:NACHT domain-containing protein [Streptomyces sp. MBT62]MBK3568896.1 NACHT domain-containing protein [Streptomyces sp. MBT62]
MSSEIVEPWQVSAVLVGIEVYQDEGREDLPGAARDALRFAAWLRECQVPAENITLLLTCTPGSQEEAREQAAKLGLTIMDATFSDIRSAFLALEGTRSELLFTFWSGHGVMHPSKMKRYLFYGEATRGNALALTVDSLHALLRQWRYQSLKRQIFLVDSCGWFLRQRDGEPIDVPFNSDDVAQVPTDQFDLFASREGQASSHDPGAAIGEFTQKVVDSLSNSPVPFPPDLERLTKEVTEHFNARDDTHHQQTPVSIHNRASGGASREFTSGLFERGQDLASAPDHLKTALGELHEESRKHIDRFLLSRAGIATREGPKAINVRYSTLTAAPGVPPGSSYDMVRRFYDTVPHGRLAITGGPGSGKTVLAIRLVSELLTQRRADQPVPVLLTLVNWRRPSDRLKPDGSQTYEDSLREHFENWLVDQLLRQELCASRDAARLLVSGRWVLPILDGLDEAHALQTTNSAPHESPEGSGAAPLRQLLTAVSRYQFQGVPSPVVVIARSTLNDELMTGLSSACVVEMQRLSVSEIKTSLLSTVPEYASDGLWAAVREDLAREEGSVAARRLDTPWKLTLAVRAITVAKAISPTQLVEPGSTRHDGILHERLLAAFVPAACADTVVEKPRWSDAGKVTGWLSLLACYLDGHQSEDLALSRLWLIAGARPVRVVQTILHVTVVGFFGFACILAALGGAGNASVAYDHLIDVITGSTHLSGDTSRRFWAASAFATATVAAAAITGWMRRTWTPAVSRRTRNLRMRVKGPSRKARLMRVCSGIEIGSAIGLAFGTAFFLLFGWAWGLAMACTVGIPLGYGLEAKVGLDRTLSGNFAPAYYWVWEGIALGAGTITGAAVFWLIGSSPWAGAGFGAAVGYFGAFAIGLIAWLRYVIAMSLMRLRGQLPWKIAAFLDWAHRVGVLRIHGVAWQFRHTELQHWLSSQPAKSPPPPRIRGQRRRRLPAPE